MSIPEALIADMIQWRHTLHACPEMAFEEVSTAQLVASVLRAHGITVQEGVGRTGVVGSLSRGTGPSIGLRADMDALPLVEKNQFAHKSQHEGKMHACGHDGHTAMLLGAAVALSQRSDWQGTVHFIFQPAEEAAGGGRVMVEDGLFERFPCDAVFGMHNWPGLPLGRFAINHGPMMASFDTFEIQIQGAGGHAAMPEKSIDSLVCASHLVVALQTIVSRRLPPQETAVVSVTQIHGGEAWNVLPDSTVIRGTVRCFSIATQRRIHALLTELSEGTARTHGATASVSYHYAYPATINSAAETDMAIVAATATVGAGQVQRDCSPSMASEDFAFMLNNKPGAYIWLGVDQDSSVPLHNPHYDFNDEALALGAAYWVALVNSRMGPGAR
ncbi:M20 aminoacylase family protein [Polaromonas sp. UC242_47]|uniref:M20 aminoacylase family protein n=1 Tax=Polaromonas sp. UC242_47 TaxID=3374626 RepID=UPI0037895EC3